MPGKICLPVQLSGAGDVVEALRLCGIRLRVQGQMQGTAENILPACEGDGEEVSTIIIVCPGQGSSEP